MSSRPVDESAHSESTHVADQSAGGRNSSGGQRAGSDPPSQPSDQSSPGSHCFGLADLGPGRQDPPHWSGSPHSPDANGSLRQVGEFLLVREIGRGGMGVVYEAVQPALARRVALKILPYSHLLDTRQLLRFRNESLAAARLDHPNIVRVISVGRDGDMHYYAMQYVEGESLADILAKMRRTDYRHDTSTQFAELSQGPAQEHANDGQQGDEQRDDGSSPTIGVEFFRRVAGWGVQAADGLDHAHAIGVIHRDIKPSNLLLDASGRILIADFGVALMQNAPELTMTGDLLGTARYMSPEQWQGKPGLVDHRADIYSLGATLYELLTLRPVLRGDDRQQLQRQIIDETPPAPRSLLASIPRDLETIVLKALAKDREDRYSTAQEMADDLRCFLDDQPIRARRPTLPQRVFRWARRHRMLVAASVIALALVALGLAVSTSVVLMQRDQIQATLSKNRELLHEARQAERRAELLNSKLYDHLYSVKVRLAYRAWHTADVGHALQMLQQLIPGEQDIDRRGFEWYLLWRMLHAHDIELVGHRDEVYSTAFSHDGKWLATAGKDAEVRIWNAKTGELKSVIREHATEVNGLAFRDDGQQLATASEDGVVRLFDVDSGSLEAELIGHMHGVFCVQYAGGGDLLVSAGRGGTVRLWDPRQHHQLDSFKAHNANIEAIDLSPDGTLLATGSRDDTIRLWDVARRKLMRPLLGHRDTVLAVAFSPDGKQLASGGEDQSVLLWDVESGQLVKQMQGHGEWVQSVAFAGQGKAVVSASKDSTARIWEASTGKGLEILRGHRGRIWNVNVSPDDETLVTAGADGSVKLWKWSSVQRYGVLAAQDNPLTAVAVSPDGLTFAVADAGGILSLCDTLTGRVMHRVTAHRGECHKIAFTANAASLVTAGKDGKVRMWDAANATLQHELGQCERPIQAIELNPSKTQIVCLSGDGQSPSTLRVWHRDALDAGLATIELPIGEACCGRFSPDGKWLVLGQFGGGLVALDWHRQRVEYVWEGHEHTVSQVCFNATGTLLATAADDGPIKIWNWPDGRAMHPLHGHSDAVHALAFSDDSRTLASGGDDGVARLWSVSTGQELTMLATLDHMVRDMLFLPQNRGLMAITDSPGDDALLSWFADETTWPHPLLGSPSDAAR
jgi:WD40 repeat protein/serine/threonine protein kinase